MKDGKIWSATGITSKIDDLAAEFPRMYFDKEVVEEAKDDAEAVPKPDTPDPYPWILKGIDLGGTTLIECSPLQIRASIVQLQFKDACELRRRLID